MYLSSMTGAFKINYNTDISEYPILQFYSGANVEYEYQNGRLVTIIFKNYYNNGKKKYLFKEFYSKDGIRYELYEEGQDKPLKDYRVLKETKNLQEVHDNSFMMAVQFMINKSKKFKGRGQSILDKKIDDFDSFDEVWSQWIEALRDNKTQTYITEELLPKDSN